MDTASRAAQIVLAVEDLATSFPTEFGEVRAVDGVSFALHRGEVVGLVGESGSGKSVAALSIMGLVEKPGRVARGAVRLHGADLVGLPERALRSIRGGKISMIFQEPMTSLNPVYTVGRQVDEALALHTRLAPEERRRRILEVFTLVRIPRPAKTMRQYPHQLSGGMRQRVMIAMAMCTDPDVILCDEPTTALDVTIQRQILGILAGLRAKRGTAMLFITHDLAVVSEIADTVLVMYAGEIVERGGVDRVLASPLHPYTEALMRAIPMLSAPHDELATIPGMLPGAANRPPGCLFAPRCPYARIVCGAEHPRLEPRGDGEVRCHRYGPAWEAGS